MGRFIGYFARGLVLLVPIALTAYVCWSIFTTVDGWLGLRIPGAGFVVTIAIVTIVGFLGSTIITRSFFVLFDRLLVKVPLVRLLYSAIKDLLNAFVGEKRRFDQPVSVTLYPGNGIQMFGFVTQDSLAHLGLTGVVSVYCPHSYAWAGQMLVVPANQVQPLPQPSSEVMAFIVSGGVTGFPSLASNAPATVTSARSAAPAPTHSITEPNA
ncbi:MAG: DUF502 domain-containing protein [Gemmatimonadota bacterium]|nr:DUF502 domain-containing protein [Gemmatimonadota bacterium]